MTPLEQERAARGLPAYRARRAPRHHHRPEGAAGHLTPLERGRLRTLIARMVRDDPGITNGRIALEFGAVAHAFHLQQHFETRTHAVDHVRDHGPGGAMQGAFSGVIGSTLDNNLSIHSHWPFYNVVHSQNSALRNIDNRSTHH